MNAAESIAPAMTHEEHAAAYAAKLGCRACSQGGRLLNPKTLYCASCQKECDEILAQRDARLLSRQRQKSHDARAEVHAATRTRPTRVGVGGDGGEGMHAFMSAADWQDALHPNEGDH